MRYQPLPYVICVTGQQTIAGRIMASLLQVACTRFDRVNADKVAAHAVEATDALLAELERTAK